MDYLKAILLAIVEGVTEFLPISSTGHLVLVGHYLDFGTQTGFAESFDVIIQLPAIGAVLLYFWKDLSPFADDGQATRKVHLWGKILLAVLPAVVFGLLLQETIKEHFFKPLPVAIALLVGGIILILIERREHQHQIQSVHAITYRIAILIGCFQCLALFPGTSRSAATIIGAILLGANRVAAAEFSFFLAIPTMLGATIYTLATEGINFTTHQWGLLAIGSLVSFAVAYAAIAFLMHFIKKHRFTIFGYYRIILAILVLLLLKWPFSITATL